MIAGRHSHINLFSPHFSPLTPIPSFHNQSCVIALQASIRHRVILSAGEDHSLVIRCLRNYQFLRRLKNLICRHLTFKISDQMGAVVARNRRLPKNLRIVHFAQRGDREKVVRWKAPISGFLISDRKKLLYVLDIEGRFSCLFQENLKVKWECQVPALVGCLHMDLSLLKCENKLSLGIEGRIILLFDLECGLGYREIALSHQFEHFQFLNEDQMIVGGTYHKPTIMYWF